MLCSKASVSQSNLLAPCPLGALGDRGSMTAMAHERQDGSSLGSGAAAGEGSSWMFWICGDQLIDYVSVSRAQIRHFTVRAYPYNQ